MIHYVRLNRTRTYGKFDRSAEYEVVGYTTDCFEVIDDNGDRVYVPRSICIPAYEPEVALSPRQRESLRGPSNPFYMNHDGLD